MKRIHVHVGVKDLQQSIRFYSALFAAQPTVLKDHTLESVPTRDVAPRPEPKKACCG